MNNISIILNGGLGNRMFQIASCFGISKKQNKNFSISTSHIIQNAHSNINYFESIFKKVPIDKSVKYTYFFEEPNDCFGKYLDNIPNKDENILLSGFFQSEKYFENYKEDIYNLFEIDNLIKLYITNKYKNLENSYFLHIRRGDYLDINNKHHYIFLDYYYENCLNLLEKNCKIIVFSDDIEYCKNMQLFKNRNIDFITNENEINSLYLMSLCKLGGICSNSTFSWWGAYLNNNPNKFVTFPDKWFNNNYEIDIGFKGCKLISRFIKNVKKNKKKKKDIKTKINYQMISILIPFHSNFENSLLLLKETLNSVILQTYKYFEILIGVNGHELDSLIFQNVEKLSLLDDRIRVLHYKVNPDSINKKSETLNQMVKDVRYSIICLLDADDIWLPEKLEKQIKYIDNYDVIGTASKYFGNKEEKIDIPVEDISNCNPFTFNPIVNSSCMIKIIDAKWNNNIFGVEDYDLWLKLFCLKKKIYNVPEVLTLHRIHNTSNFNNKNNIESEKIKNIWMNRKPVTIVTCYYHIPSKYTNEKYLNWIENFLSKIPCHLVVYTDKDIYPILNKMRSKYLDRTKIIIKPFNDLYMYKYMDTWKYHKEIDHEKYHTEELYILWNEKTNFLTESIKLNPFNSDYYFWCDIGSFRNENHLKYLVNFPNPDTVYNLNSDKIYILQIEEFYKNELVKGVNGLPDYDFKNVCRVGGGIFGGHKNTIQIWNEKYYNMLKLFIDNNRFAGKDQNIMASIYVMYPELVELVKHKPYFNNGDLWFYLQYYLS